MLCSTKDAHNKRKPRLQRKHSLFFIVKEDQRMLERGYAKINFSLDVLSKRDDGYHEIRSVMHTISLHDRIIITKIDEGIELSTNRSYLPTDERNLCYRIAKYMQETYKLPFGMHIELLKMIPVSAGLAGGSADAAATLRAINTMYRLGLSLSELAKIGERFGSDIPFCIYGGTMLVEGRGERVTQINHTLTCYGVVCKPRAHISTATIYEHFELGAQKETTDAVIQALRDNNYPALCASISNMLESVTVQKEPIIQSLKERMCELGLDVALMSGSGSTVYGLTQDKELARRVSEQLRKEYKAESFYVDI